MGAIRSFDAIIQRVSTVNRALASDEKIVIIDCKTKKAVAKKPWLGVVKYFLVRNTSDGANPAEYEVPPIPIRDLERERGIGLKVKCWISCRPNNEEAVAERLFDAERGPSEMFEKLIKRCVDDFVNSLSQTEAEFIDRYFELKEGLQTRIKTQALADASLDLRVKVSLDGQDTSFGLVKIATGSFLVRLSDYHEQQDLAITCHLEVDEAKRIYANVYRHRIARLKDVVLAETQRFLQQSVTLEQFYDDLNDIYLIAALRAALEKRLLHDGRRIGFIHLESTASDSAPKQFEGRFDVDITIQEYPETITVQNHARMTRQNVALYKAKGSPKLGIWLGEQLQQIIPDVLFSEKYLDLLLDFRRQDDDGKPKPRLRKSIEDKLKNEANKIGYDVRYLTTIPNLKPLTWLEPFSLDTEGTFETRLSNFFVKLSIPVTARLETLEHEKVKGLLNQQQDIPKLMREKVITVTRQFLHTVDPERFYTTFSFPNEMKYPGEKAIEEELISLVTTALKDDFRAEVISIVPKVVDTEPIIRWRELQEKVCDFKFEVTPLRGGEPVFFTGKFQVESIDENGWYKFQSRKFTVDDIRRHLEDDVRAKLKTASKEELLYKGLGHLAEIQRVITEMAISGVKEVYGLVISLSTIDREHTEVETEINREIIARDLAAIRIAEQKRLAGMNTDEYFAHKKGEEVRLLIDERLRLGADAPDAQIKEFEDRIESERRKLTPDLISPLEAVERILRPDLPGESRLIDHTKFKALGVGSNETPRSTSEKEEAEK